MTIMLLDSFTCCVAENGTNIFKHSFLMVTISNECANKQNKIDFPFSQIDMNIIISSQSNQNLIKCKLQLNIVSYYNQDNLFSR